MSIHEMLIAVMALFAILGGLDRIFGSRLGLGQEFENGILAMGSMGLAMIGIISLAPVLAGVLRPVVVPVYRFLGADPAMFAGTLLACDMGGGQLAQELSTDARAAGLGGSADTVAVRNLKNCLVRLRTELKLPATLAQAGVDPRRVWYGMDKIVEATLSDPCCSTNPIAVEDFMVRQVLEEVMGRV